MESSKNALPEGWTPPLPTHSVEPNCLTYRDNNGVEHRIYTPQGTLSTAWDHLENERWDELLKFAPYTNQGYTADDYKPIIRDTHEKAAIEDEDDKGETSAKSKSTH